MDSVALFSAEDYLLKKYIRFFGTTGSASCSIESSKIFVASSADQSRDAWSLQLHHYYNKWPMMPMTHIIIFPKKTTVDIKSSSLLPYTSSPYG